MSALIRKEIRTLLPVFSLALASSIFTWLFAENDTRFVSVSSFIANISCIVCPVLLIIMALTSFGSELTAGTFSNLLTQPISRQRIWRTKIAVLVGAFLLIFFINLAGQVFFKPLYWYGERMSSNAQFSYIITRGIIISVTLLTGGLWTVLLLRQVAAAFWFTLLIPLAILMLAIGATGKESDEISGPLFLIFTLYSIAGFFWARRMFLRAQDTQWTGGIIALPELPRFASASSASHTRRERRPCLALLAKEFQLHQSLFVIAGVLTLLHLSVIFYRNLRTDLVGHPDLDFILHNFWLLWLIMPLLIGSAAVSEERKLNTLEAQFCLPIDRRIQWLAKLFIAMVLTVLLGACLPLLFEGARIFPTLHLRLSFLDDPRGQFAMLCALCIAITGISLYTSTLARNTLQAIGPALVMVIGIGMLISAAPEPFRIGGDYPWRGTLIYLVGFPVFIILVIGLSYWNFKWPLPTGKVFRRNISLFIASFAFVILTTAAVYHRAWERFTPAEPSHGPARLTPAGSATLTRTSSLIMVRLPDNRMWVDYLKEYSEGVNPHVLDHPTSYIPPFFLEGSDWLTVEQDWADRQMIGLKTDGTLWISEKVMSLAGFTNHASIIPEKMVQFGTDTDWKAILPYGRLQFMLKNNGTLWQWGRTNSFPFTNTWAGYQDYTPFQLNAGSDWAEISSISATRCFRKTDGSVWTFEDRYLPAADSVPRIELAPGFVLQRSTRFENSNFLSRVTLLLSDGMSYQLGIHQDGSFRIMADKHLDMDARYYTWHSTDLQIGSETNWLAVTALQDYAVTLKRDGSLWLWNFRFNSGRGSDVERDEHDLTSSVPVQLGTHSDWVAIAYKPGGLLSLAADGSLVFWPLAPAIYFNSPETSAYPPLLEISHKPQKLATLFDTK